MNGGTCEPLAVQRIRGTRAGDWSGAIAHLAGVPEVRVVFALLLLAAAAAFHTGAAFLLPSRVSASFLGMHFVAPVMLAATAAAAAGLASGRRAESTRSAALLNAARATAPMAAFVVTMYLHFHLKLWVPLLRRPRFDHVYRSWDAALEPIPSAFVAVRGWVAHVAPFPVDALYLRAFLAMFAVSFLAHALLDRTRFRELVLASTLTQGIGAVAYFAAPAVGPFVFAPGVNGVATAAQQHMWAIRTLTTDLGIGWLNLNGGVAFVAGLGAMPSLHAGGAATFVYYAATARRLRPLLILYVPTFVWILVEAVASRWHYFVDLPAGLLVSAAAIALTQHLLRGRPIPQRPPIRPAAS